MTKDELIKEIETEFKELFPDLSTSEHKKQYENFEKIILAFILPFQKEEMFTYMTNRDESISIALHIANIPQGIEYFENWFQDGLFLFVAEIFDTLKQTLPEDKVYLSFAQFLDNKDFNTLVNKSKFSKEDEQKIGILFLPMLKNPEFEPLMQAMACMYVDLNNSANSLLKQWIQTLWFDGNDIQKVIDEAKAIVAVKDNATKAGKKGASTRWAAKNTTKKYAIELFKNGRFNNPSQAANDIALKVIEFGKNVGFTFTSNFQAQRTIYNWLLKE